MSTMVELGKVGDLADGFMKRLTVHGRDVLVARAKDRYYVADNRCPHLGGDLSQGKLEGTVVTCPRHSSQFDLADGRVVRWTNWSGIKLSIARILKAPRPLMVYRVTVEDGRIMAEM